MGESAILIDDRGVAAIAEVLPNHSPRMADGAIRTTPAFTSFFAYRDGFRHKLQAAAPTWTPGTDWAWVSADRVSALVVDDDYTPISVSQVAGRMLGATQARLERIAAPTLVFSADAPIVTSVITAALKRAEGASSDLMQNFRMREDPVVSLGEGVVGMRVPIAISTAGIEIEATLAGIAGAVLRGREAFVSGALDNVTFEKVTLTDAASTDWPVGPIAQMAAVFVDSTLRAINGFLVDHPISLPIAPLVAAGDPAEPVPVTVGNRHVTLLSPMVEEWALLIHPEGIAIVAQVGPYREDATPYDADGADRTAAFRDVVTLMREHVAAIDPNYAIDQPGFRVSDAMLADWLAPITVAPRDPVEAHMAAIRQAHQGLRTIAGPDLVVSAPLLLLKEIATRELAGRAKDLARYGLEIDPTAVELSFGEQAIATAFPFDYRVEQLEVRGRAKGRVFVGHGSDGPLFQPVLDDFQIDSVSAGSEGFLDVSRLADSVTLLSDQLLPIVNGSLKAVEIAVTQPDPYKLDLGRAAARVEGLTVTPTEFEIPAPTAARPVMLVTDDRVAAIADLEADYLSARVARGGEDLGGGTAAHAFRAYAAEFEKAWKSRFEWPETVSTVLGAVSTERVSQTIENLWRRAGIRVSFSGRRSAASSRQPVAAVAPEPRCGGLCKRPTCDRSECLLREQCEKLTRWLGGLFGGWASRLVCKQVLDPTCILRLDACNLEWTLYDACAAPFQACSGVIGVVASGLRAFDFDKFGYASVDADVEVSVVVDASSRLGVDDELRTVALRPTVVGDLTIDARVRFEPRASAFLGCVPFEPLRMEGYGLSLSEQTPRLVARIAPVVSEDDTPAGDGLDLLVRLDPITLSGQFSEAPLTKLLRDNPATLLTCPVVYSAVPALELLGATSLTRDALVAALRAMEGDDEEASRILRMMLDGKVARDVALPSVRISIPLVEARIGSDTLKFVPSWSGREIRFGSR